MNRSSSTTALAACVILTSGPWASRAAERDRLIPTAQRAAVTIKGSRDGQAVDLVVTNDSDWVLTSVEVTCKAEVTPRPVGCSADDYSFDLRTVLPNPTGKKLPPLPPLPAACYASRYGPPEVLKQTFIVKVLPHSSSNLYAEVAEGRATSLGECYLNDHRGRERNWRDFF